MARYLRGLRSRACIYFPALRPRIKCTFFDRAVRSGSLRRGVWPTFSDAWEKIHGTLIGQADHSLSEFTMECGRILLVSDSAELRAAWRECVSRSGMQVEITAMCTLWQGKAVSGFVRGIVLDTKEGTLADPENISEFAALCSSLPVLVLTAAGDVPTAVKAIRYGAREVIQKPVQLSRVLEKILKIVAVDSQELSSGSTLS